MTKRVIPLAALIVVATLVSASRVAAQITLPVKQHEALEVQLQSLRDHITLFRGDPQQLLVMNVRPDRFRPRVDYISQANAVLRIRDRYAIDHPDFGAQTPEERDKSNDVPLEEEWEIRLSPSGRTSFQLHCERGESSFDFTDLEVKSVQLRADETKVKVEFSRPNSIVLDRFAARVPSGSLEFLHMINARAKEITLDVEGSACHFEVTGKEFAGECLINVLGTPSEMQLLVSRKVALRVTGPAATIARFEDSHLIRSGEDWVSKDYETAKCRVRLTFGAEVPKVTVEWE